MTRQLIAVAAVGAALLLAGCSRSGSGAPDQAACWAAMVSQYRNDVATGATGTYPAACHGVPDAVLQSYAFQILAGNTGSPTP